MQSINAHIFAPARFLDGSEAAPMDATATLSYAVDKVQQLRRKHRFGSRALTLESVKIPPDCAKQWIDRKRRNSSFARLPADTACAQITSPTSMASYCLHWWIVSSSM